MSQEPLGGPDPVPPGQGAGGQPPHYGALPPATGGYGYGPQYGPQPPMGYPTYAPSPQNSGKATAILVLGIVGITLVCAYGVGVIPAIVALAMAPGAKREIRESGGRIVGDSLINAGVICSWVTVGIVALGAVFGILMAIIVAATGAS